MLAFVLKTLAGDDSGMTAMHLSLPRPWQTLKMGKITKKVLADPLSIQIAKNSMIAMMRYLADLWIDSGKSGEGENRVDNPSRRNVEYRPPTPTPQIVLNPNEETPIDDWNAFPISLGLPISDLFYDLVGDEARWPQIHKDGTQSLKEPIFGFTLAKNPSDNPSDRFVLHLVLHGLGKKVAMYWFARLLDSPFPHLLARCDDCATYFAYERAPRTDIKGGTHCPNCKRYGSAKRMKSTRDKRIAEMVVFAADVYGKYKPNSRQSLTKWIAECVNRRTESISVKAGKQGLSHHPTITSRWVTEHLKQIEAEMERRNNAKG